MKLACLCNKKLEGSVERWRRKIGEKELLRIRSVSPIQFGEECGQAERERTEKAAFLVSGNIAVGPIFFWAGFI
jgi:hypothetical protein